jgi:hypothetical protein
MRYLPAPAHLRGFRGRQASSHCAGGAFGGEPSRPLAVDPQRGVEAVAGVADQVERCGPASEGVSWDGAIRHPGHPQRLRSGDEPYGA